MTQFVSTSVYIPVVDRSITIDGNSKISGWDHPAPNALSLPAPGCCPDSTPSCRAACYASSERSTLPGELRERYTANECTVRAILGATDGGYVAAAQLSRWIAEHCRTVGFRWHVSGDVISDQHAWWIVSVAIMSPEVQHWIYTRTLRAVPILQRAENLAVNISADRDNYPAVVRVAHDTGARLTYLWRGELLPELPQGSVLFPDYSLRAKNGGTLPPAPWRAMICPGDFFGQSARLRCGVCTKCGNPRHVVQRVPSDNSRHLEAARPSR
jgi:hypothetical protein